MSDKGIRILVIDGEGSPVIGVVPSVRVLDEMMSRIAFDEDTPQESVLPCKYFDLIVGSGDGGWIALMLGRLGMSASRTKTVYEEIHAFIHHECASLDPVAKAEALELRLKTLICEETGQNDADLEKLQDSQTAEPRCKVAVLTKDSLNIGAPILLRTYRVRDNQTENCPIWVAIRACTARPNVFPEVNLSRRRLISASLGHNNPIESAIHEALVAFPRSRIDCIVSLGSGHPGHSELQSASLDSFVRAATDLAQGAEQVSQEFARRWYAEGRGDTHFRFNVQQGLQAYAQAGYDSALSHTGAYLEDPAVGDALNAAISTLRGPGTEIGVDQTLPSIATSTSGIIHTSNAPPIQTYVYALYEEGLGLPLWDPQPLYKAKPVEIGDVGLLTEFGAFEILFNATLPPASQPGYRLPPDFEPLPIHPSDVRLDPEALNGPFLAQGHVISNSQGLESAEASSQRTQKAFTFSFTATNGAALVLKDLPTRVVLTPERRIRDYIVENCRSWYHYYEHDSQGPRRDLHGSSLIFVTGVIQNSQWALGAWSSLESPIEVSYSGHATLGSRQVLDLAGHWVPSGRRDVKQGPTAARGTPQSKLRQDDASESLQDKLTQSLFVRGYIVGVRDARPETLEPLKVYPLPYKSWWDILRQIFAYGIPSILRAAAEPQNPPPPPPPPTAPAILAKESSNDENQTLVETKDLAPRRQLRHPADDIIDSMFKMDSSLDIIIVHDDTIVNLIRSVEHRQNENLDQLLDRPCDLLPKQNNATRPIDLSGMKFPKNQSMHQAKFDIIIEDKLDENHILANLTNLSNDLLLSIFSICDARSIVKLRQCCIDLREVSYNHTVWFEVLKGTCIDLGLPVPTFPQTTSTSTDFERLATAWIRFQSVLSYAKDGQPPPHKMVRSIDITERIIALQQSLDGRFLFVLHTTGIRVWSLEDVSPLQVHYFGAECPTNFEAFLWVVNETSNSTILCLVWGTAKSHDCFAFRFSFPSHGHQGTQLISLSKFDFRHFPIKDWKCVVAKSTLFTALYTHPVEGTCYLLFDLVGGACATWRAESFDNPSNLFITRGFIVSLNGENQAMVVYALPELPEKDSYAPQIWAKLSNPALFHVSARPDRLNHQRVSRVSFMRSSTNGYAHSDYRGNVLINEDPDGHWLLEIVALHQTTELVSETFPALPLELERSTLQIRDHHSFPISQAKMGYAYMSPDQNLLLYATSSDGAQIVFHLSALAKDGSRVELKRGILCDSDDEFEFDDATMSLCPFTGRLCVASSDRIKVIDFVTI